MSSNVKAQEEYCRYRTIPNTETIFYFIDSGGKKVDPKVTGFLAPRIRHDTPQFGTQAFADFISSAWPTQADDRPELLRLYINKFSAAADYVMGDRVWSIKVHKMSDANAKMWKAYALVACHTPALNVSLLNHEDTMLLLSHIPAFAV
ncbi:hypothetical protein DSL72_003361 [Monilinia vaccinii-corymbosi]|uniref:Uncharacterized protein n=1 Tax=Monilinia vaccinii-corymbosi TaxID=61207 RepID=A0A8A3P103_9HELO|nr:hypothetical protein DSL72_003361 [Monilinia vaccinii-corymbosi]